jgi:3-hydroxy-9,10-secoandrosta-1,3,5(10)-triene-9,17-dione monooxygenase reductase component
MSNLAENDAKFRTTLGRLPTGVVVVTGGESERPRGLVVGSFMSVSLDPPLVAVCPAKTSTSWPSLARTGKFCANVLHDSQLQVARTFARSGGNKFAQHEWRPAPVTGAPLLHGVAAWIDCEIRQTTEAGDHWLVLAEVMDLDVEEPGGALIFHAGTLKSLV